MAKRGEILILAGVGLAGLAILFFLQPSNGTAARGGVGAGGAAGGPDTLPFGGTSGIGDPGGTGGAPPPGEGGPQFVFNLPGTDTAGAGFTEAGGPSGGEGTFTQRFVDSLFSPENLAFTAPFIAIPAIAGAVAASRARRAAQAGRAAATAAQTAGGVPRQARTTPGRAPRLPRAAPVAAAATPRAPARPPARVPAAARALPTLGRIGGAARILGPVAAGALTAVQVADVAGAIASGSRERAGAAIGFTPEQTARFQRQGPTVGGFFEAIGTGLKATFIDAPLSLIPTAAAVSARPGLTPPRAATPAPIGQFGPQPRGPTGVQALTPTSGGQFQRPRPGVAPRIVSTTADLTEAERRALRA